MSLDSDIRLVRDELEMNHAPSDAMHSEIGPCPACNAIAAFDRLLSRLSESEVYAKEGWDWLADALVALGARTVFDIGTAGAHVEQVRRERDQWEERYEMLLSEVGGTLPS